MSSHERRVFTEALARLHDADILANSLETQSDAPLLLRVLGFEVLLKCVVLLAGGTPRTNHDYLDHWQMLPPSAQADVLRAAQDFAPARLDAKNVDAVLSACRRVVINDRYYDRSAGEPQQRSLFGMRHKESCPYPKELECLIYGLRVLIETRLELLDPERGQELTPPLTPPLSMDAR
jgi:hypothetical protein